MTSDETSSSSGPWPIFRVSRFLTDAAHVPPSLFPANVVVEQMDPALASTAELHPAESSLVAHAVDIRQREFAAGRLCARRALGRLGVPVAPLLAQADRRPAWPSGIVGSISHTLGVCAVAVARTDEVAGIGFDVEPASALPLDVWKTVLTDAEREQLRDYDKPDRSIRARLVFSAKEAFYKCYRSAGGDWLDFHDLEMRQTPASDDMELRSRKPLWERAPLVEGRYALTPQFIFTAFTARALRI